MENSSISLDELQRVEFTVDNEEKKLKEIGFFL